MLAGLLNCVLFCPRFQLLSKIRVAKRFSRLDDRRQLVGNRLQALAIFLQVVKIRILCAESCLPRSNVFD
jgi:hypothetical protein